MQPAITYETVDRVLARWVPYMTDIDFNTVREFVYNTANHIPCDKMLVFYGQGGTGKTSLANDIISLIGEENTTNQLLSSPLDEKDRDTEEEEEHEPPYTKQLIVCNLNEYMHNFNCDYVSVWGHVRLILSREMQFIRKECQQTKMYIPTANIILVHIGDDIIDFGKQTTKFANFIHFC